MNSVYSKKYIKYKSKYFDLKQQGGMTHVDVALGDMTPRRY